MEETMISLLQRVCKYIESKEDLRNFSEKSPGKQLYADVLKQIAKIADAPKREGEE